MRSRRSTKEIPSGRSRRHGPPPSYSLPFSTDIADVGSVSEQHIHGGLLPLTTGAALNSSPVDIDVTTGQGKLVLVLNAGSDISGTITVTGTSVDRDTGATTASDTDDIVVDALTVDGADTDANGNVRHSLTGAYITSKWFTGAVTISTADTTFTDVDVYHMSFEQVNDASAYALVTLDMNSQANNTLAELDVYLYAAVVTGSKVDVTREGSLNLTGVTADRIYRNREGNIGKAMDGRTDGFWVDLFNKSANKIENLTMKVWVTVVGSGTDILAIAATGGVTDHGELDGLNDNDHTHYYEVGGANPLTASLELGAVLRDFVNSDSDILIRLIGGTSVVNYLQVTAGVTGTPGVVMVEAVGSDTDVDLRLIAKGAGVLALNSDSLVSVAKKIQFRDSAIFIHSDADGELSIEADTRVKVKFPGKEIARILSLQPPENSGTDIATASNFAGGSTPGEVYRVVAFDDGTIEYMDVGLRISDEYDGSSAINVRGPWMPRTAVASRVVEWVGAFRRLNFDSEDLSASFNYATNAQSLVDDAPSTQGHMTQAVIPFTNAQADGIQPGELANLRIWRDTTPASGTNLSGDALLHAAALQVVLQ